MTVTTDASSNETRAMEGNTHRLLPKEMELDSTFYCSLAASKVLGPSEPAIVQNFGELVDKLSLDSIRQVAECQPLRFEKGIVLSVPANVANATQDELDLIGQIFIDTYNQQNQQEDGFCDEYFRKLLDFQVSRIPPDNDGFNVLPMGEGQVPDGRKLVTRRSYHRKTARSRQRRTVVPIIVTKSNSDDPMGK